jgi:hypothetical protein
MPNITRLRMRVLRAACCAACLLIACEEAAMATFLRLS